jgi:HlyD family secretion protein
MKSLVRVLITLLVLGGLGGGGYYWWKKRQGADELTYVIAPADRGDVVAAVVTTGTLQPVITVAVGSQVSGTINKIKVDFNSVVKKGDILATIDPAVFKANVLQARANLASARGMVIKAEAAMVDAKRVFERQKQLISRELSSIADRDTAQANYEQAVAALASARAQVEQARAALGVADLNLEYTIIKSPVDGVVINRAIDNGQTVAASFQAPMLFQIAQDLAKMQVHANVAESDIGGVIVGLPGSFTVDAFRNRNFKAVVSQVRKSPQIIQNVVNYDVVMDVDNQSGELLPGMTANLKLETGRAEKALRIPNAALRFRPPPSLLEKLKKEDGDEGGGDKGGKGDKKKRGLAGGEKGQSGVAHAADRPGDGGAAGTQGPDGGPVIKKWTAPKVVDPGRPTVWILRKAGNKPYSTNVQVGVTDGIYTEVKSGLKDDDQVIVELTGKKSTKPARRLF